MNSLTPREHHLLHANPSAEVIPEAQRAGGERSHGLGGFLAVYIFGCFAGPGLIFLAFMTTLANSPAVGNSSPSRDALVAGIIGLVYVGMSLWAAITLIRHRTWSSVLTVIQIIWIAGPAVTAAVWWITHGDSLPVTSIAASAIFAGLWTAYFLRSKRVRNTYPRSFAR